MCNFRVGPEKDEESNSFMKYIYFIYSMEGLYWQYQAIT